MNTRRIVAIFALALGLSSITSAQDVDAWDREHSWEGALPIIREGKHKAYILFIGRKNSLMWQRIRENRDQMGDAFVFRLSANDEVTNPYSGRKVLGSQVIMNMTGPLTDLTGSSFLFFDKDFILLPRFTLIHNFHRNRSEVIGFYAALVCDPLRDRVTFAEFARYNNSPIGLTLTMEAEAKRHKDFSHLHREVPKDEILFRGVDNTGTVVNPRDHTGLHIITKDPHGEVFLAQAHEIWEKLSVDIGGQKQRPPLVIFGPALASYPGLDAMGIRYTTVSLTEEQLRDYPSPRIMLPEQGGTDPNRRGAMEFTGFIPGQVLGEFILGKNAKGLINDFRNLHPDIAVGDVDYEGVQVKKP